VLLLVSGLALNDGEAQEQEHGSRSTDFVSQLQVWRHDRPTVPFLSLALLQPLRLPFASGARLSLSGFERAPS
jgi:hypothetical protein